MRMKTAVLFVGLMLSVALSGCYMAFPDTVNHNVKQTAYALPQVYMIVSQTASDYKWYLDDKLQDVQEGIAANAFSYYPMIADIGVHKIKVTFLDDAKDQSVEWTVTVKGWF
jgi:hypothetical protein